MNFKRLITTSAFIGLSTLTVNSVLAQGISGTGYTPSLPSDYGTPTNYSFSTAAIGFSSITSSNSGLTVSSIGGGSSPLVLDGVAGLGPVIGNTFGTSANFRLDFAAPVTAFAFGYKGNTRSWTLSAYSSSNVLLGTTTWDGFPPSSGLWVGYSAPAGISYATLTRDPNYSTDLLYIGKMTSWSGGAAAPEIDGSLAPKVGFLLGCLFLMFGRKKQNTEPMMTA